MQEGLSVAEAFEVKLLRQVALAGSFGKRSMGLFAKVGGGVPLEVVQQMIFRGPRPHVKSSSFTK